MHQPKLLLILLIIAAQIDKNLIGVGYFVLILLLAPIPIIAKYLWPLIAIYSALVMLAEYIFQFPYFVVFLHCNSTMGSIPSPSYSCSWLSWAGFNLKPSGYQVGYVMWVHLLILILSATQRVCNRWRVEMILAGTYTVGVLLPDHKEGQENSNVTKRAKKLREYTISACRFIFDHFFDEFGYDITLFMLVIGTMIFIQVCASSFYSYLPRADHLGTDLSYFIWNMLIYLAKYCCQVLVYYCYSIGVEYGCAFCIQLNTISKL